MLKRYTYVTWAKSFALGGRCHPTARRPSGDLAACHHPLNIGLPAAPVATRAGAGAAELLPLVAGGAAGAEVSAEEAQ
jgi:hypothetical protein